MQLSVGEKTNILFAKPEGCFFEIDESGPMMFFNEDLVEMSRARCAI